MGNIALLVPREEMLYLAHNILQVKKYDIREMRVVQTEHSVAEARRAIGAGADIIIARGLQASLIKQYTDIPVVEIVMTAQEMALLVMKARKIIKKERPFIGVVGFQNMFCDMSYFNEIYNIELKTYYAPKGDRLEQTAGEAVADHVDLIIGGDVAVKKAKEAGIPSLFLSNTEDSIKMAFSVAETMDYAMSVEKRSQAQVEALLDYSFNGVIRLDAEGKIVGVNPAMEAILYKEEKLLLGKTADQLFPDMDGGKIREVLEGKQKSTSFFVPVGAASLYAVLAPVQVSGKIEGAIMTSHKVAAKKIEKKETREKKRGSCPARGNFSMVVLKSPAMKDCIHRAKLFARSEEPVFLYGEPGTEKRLLAESIHNISLCRQGPFIAASCLGCEEEVRERIFGGQGAAILAREGSLYLEQVEALSLFNQQLLCQLITYKTIVCSRLSPLEILPVRILAESALSPAKLLRLVREKKLLPELYYSLMGLVLEIPPLRSRREDIRFLIEDLLKEDCERYGRFHVLTKGGEDCLMSYHWPGNLLQMESFVKGLVLNAEKRNLDEIMVRALLNQLYPEEEREQSRLLEKSVPGEEERSIRKALGEFGGSRQKAAESLGISKATLWRRMKKYNISNYEINNSKMKE